MNLKTEYKNRELIILCLVSYSDLAKTGKEGTKKVSRGECFRLREKSGLYGQLSMPDLSKATSNENISAHSMPALNQCQETQSALTNHQSSE